MRAVDEAGEGLEVAPLAGQAHGEGVALVFFVEDAERGPGGGDGGGARVGNADAELLGVGREAAPDLGLEAGDSLARQCRNPNDAGVAARRPRVDLVGDEEDLLGRDAELLERLGRDTRLLVGPRRGGVDDVEDEIGVPDLGEGGAKRGDERGRQLSDEADGVDEDDLGELARRRPAGAGVERGEEAVGGIGRVARRAD